MIPTVIPERVAAVNTAKILEIIKSSVIIDPSDYDIF